MAHGTKRIRVGDYTIVELPKIRQTMSKRAVVREYLKNVEAKCIRGAESTIVMKVLRKVTSGQQRMKHSIDYCVGVLRLENIRSLESILKRYVFEGTLKKKMEKQLREIGDFMKHEYENHLDLDNDPAQNTKRALVG